MDRNPLWCQKTTLFNLRRPYDWEDASSTQTPELDCPADSPPRQSLSEAHGLAPRIVVTPDCAAADEGTAYIWAAVQLSTQVGRHGAPGGNPDDAAAACPIGASGEHETLTGSHTLEQRLMFHRRSAVQLPVRCIRRNTAHNKQHNLGGDR